MRNVPLLAMLALCACSQGAAPPVQEQPKVKLEKMSMGNNPDGVFQVFSMIDPETGCEYLGTSPGYLTLRYGRNGKPMCPDVPHIEGNLP